MDLQNISQKEFERIEAYLNGQLLDKERLEFEKQLKDDTDFYTKVEDIKTILLGIETQALKEQLDKFHDQSPTVSNQYTKNETKIKSIAWQKLAIAAALVIATGSFWFLSGNSNDRLYAKYFSPDPGLPTTMSSSNNYEFYEAMVNYKRGDYNTAISKWELLQKSKPNNDTLNYFIGVAYLANKNEQTAIEFLKDATINSEFPLINDAYYYLGLAYLKSGDLEKAKRSLQNSTAKNSKVLLSKLND